MITLISTWGGQDSNSYVDLTEANSIAATTLLSSPWFSFSDDLRAQALIQAARDIDSKNWIGKRLFYRQRLEFPRSFSGAIFPLTVLTDINTIDEDLFRQQQRVKEAQVFQAIDLLMSMNMPDILDMQQRGVLSLSSGGGTIQTIINSTGTGSRLCARAAELLREWKGFARLSKA